MTKSRKISTHHPKPIRDVSHPGESVPNPTSRPVIVTNRAILKDPMMTQPAPDDDGQEGQEKPGEKIDLSKVQAPMIQPLASSEVSDSDKSDESDEADSPADPDKRPEEPASQKEADKTPPTDNDNEEKLTSLQPDSTDFADPADPDDSSKLAEAAVSPDLAGDEQLGLTADEKPATSDDANADADASPVSESGDAVASPLAASESTSGLQSGEPEQDAKPAATDAQSGSMPVADGKKKEDEAKTAEKAKHDAAIQELILSKKYELPINSVEKRKNKQQVIFVAAAVLLLVLAWAGFSMATGLLH